MCVCVCLFMPTFILTVCLSAHCSLMTAHLEQIGTKTAFQVALKRQFLQTETRRGALGVAGPRLKEQQSDVQVAV